MSATITQSGNIRARIGSQWRDLSKRFGQGSRANEIFIIIIVVVVVVVAAAAAVDIVVVAAVVVVI